MTDRLSRYEMLRFYASKFVSIVATMETIKHQLRQSDSPSGWQDLNRALYKAMLLKMHEELLAIGLRQSAKKAAEAIHICDQKPISIPDPSLLLSAMQDLLGRIRDELEDVHFLQLDVEDADLFEASNPFGDQVFSVFPASNDDIAEASKCLALGRATACVMHLMRALEIALKALAGAVGVSQQNDWVLTYERPRRHQRLVPKRRETALRMSSSIRKQQSHSTI